MAQQRGELVLPRQPSAGAVVEQCEQFVAGDVALTGLHVRAGDEGLQDGYVVRRLADLEGVSLRLVPGWQLGHEELEVPAQQRHSHDVHRAAPGGDQVVALLGVQHLPGQIHVDGVLDQVVVEGLEFRLELVELGLGDDELRCLVLADVVAPVVVLDLHRVGHVRRQDPVRVVAHFDWRGVHAADLDRRFSDVVAHLGQD